MIQLRIGMRAANILICGAGIVGLTIARELLLRGHDGILVIEKEVDLGRHASGRNSGVLHAGIYYTPNSFRARFCIEGNMLMREYCKSRGIAISECGKVIVTKSEDEIPVLKALYERALRNGSKVEIIEERDLKKIEPYAKTFRLAIHSPLTAVVDPKEILFHLEREINDSGKGCILKRCRFIGLREGRRAITEIGDIKFNFFINAAGAYSDIVAHRFQLASKYRIIPFKGTYWKLNKRKSHLIKGNIYPVPDLRNPFLGVHLTRAVDGSVYIGPTAIPAFGRENYRFLSGIGAEAMKIVFRDIVLFFRNKGFRDIALTEPKKYIKAYFFNDVKRLVDEIGIDDIEPSDKVGIRPQLVDWEKKELVMDYLIIKDSESIHIMNSISPAFTSSMSFARYVVDMMELKT